MIRTLLGDVESFEGAAYLHEHLVIDSPLIADRFPHIHLHDVDAAVAEVTACRQAGAGLMVDAMPASAGRDATRLAEISRRTGVAVVGATGLHHDRYYGPRHWTNRVPADRLVELFVADLLEGVDVYDYTGPVVERSPFRAGVVKVATSGASPDARDERNLEVVAATSRITGAPVLTHCEDGRGALAQVERLVALGVPAAAIILSHVDKADDSGYLTAIAETGAVLELDQALRERAAGVDSPTVRAVVGLVAAGFEGSIVVGTDGARRTLWSALGGEPGLAWLAAELPAVLARAGVDARVVDLVMHGNARRVLAWRPAE